ncbi:MAG: STAS domain-containing protein [Lentisphaerota bacterium]
MTDGKILYAKVDNRYFIKFTGTLRYTISRGLDIFLNKMFEDPVLEDVLIDMSEAEYLDSTNLGLLAKIASMTQKRFKRKVTLFSTNPNINFLLDNMGLSQVFLIVDKPDFTAGNLQSIPGLQDTEKERALVILEAHRLLMAMNEKNRDTFKNIVEVLEKEISRN